MPSFLCAAIDPADFDGDLLIVPIAPGPDGPVPVAGAQPVLKRLGAVLEQLAGQASLEGKIGGFLLVPTLGALPATSVALVGIGAEGERTAESLRRAAAVAARGAERCQRVGTTLHQVEATGADAKARAAAVVEGFALAGYHFDTYRAERRPSSDSLTLIGDRSDVAVLDEAIAVAGIRVRATTLVRDLVNEPAGVLDPAAFADRARRLGRRHKLRFREITGPALTRGSFGGVAGVGAGAASAPRLVELRYEPAGATRRVALVGKGVCFDSGGIDLKRVGWIEAMKDDMAGAATALAVVVGAAELGLDVAVTAVLPLVENAIGAAAMRPGDVITARNGTTIEVTNTDAEGRLILADGLAFACERKPDVVVDVATLTGSVISGLGARCTGVLGNDRNAVTGLLRAAGTAGEPAWELPLLEDYRKEIDGTVGDLRNSGDWSGDAIVAGLFLREFVGSTPWVHLDIAGTANLEKQFFYEPVGGTGAMVRTLLAWITDGAPAGA